MYSLQISDFSTAGRVLGRAFQNDPIWITYAKNPEDRKSQLPAMFEFLTVMGFRYGSVWSPSEKLEGVAIWFPRKTADFGFFRILFSGYFFRMMNLFQKTSDLMKEMQGDMKQLSQDRKNYMTDRDYIYLTVIGVDPECQDQGFGGTLLKLLFEESKEKSLPVYLETETEKNVAIYSHYGFNLLGERYFTDRGLHIWQMIREP